MNRFSDRTSSLSPLKRALLALEEMQAKLDAMERLQSEPIAIIGMACRFPGHARDPEAFWRILHDGVDAITELPSGRWDIDAYYDPDPELPGKMYTRQGGFLEGIDLFDPQFFGISPREAVTLDPQHRLLLEISWEALENAGQFHDRLAGSQTGVFIGITSNDYGQLNLMSGEFSRIDAYQITGNTLNGATGRLSYTFGFQGPCMAIDTACSSSLVAVHQACRSLSNGECSQALAGGINLILSPVGTIALSKARVLSPDGRCRAFDGAANGMVRGEGCGIVVLKRLSDAVQDRDNILALIRGSAVNQDGPSSGLMVPNGPAQEMVIRRALAIAKVDPSQVSYLEAHGTGTFLGDPIEVRALGAVFGNDRPQGSPLLIGSVKTNIGHLEACSGIAGLIKVVLALNHDEIPSQLHFERPNPHISWDDSPVQVVTKPTPWPQGEKSRIAGVSSFGFSGTNAHVVLEEAPVSATVVSEVERPLHLMALSAKTEAALRQLAARYLNHLAANPDLTLGDVCFTANAGRSHFTHRLGVVAASSTEMRESLSAFVAGQDKEGILKGESHAQPRVAFMFTGQGSQYLGMGHELYRTQPTFRQALDRCDEILGPYLDESLLDVMYLARPESSPLGETAYTQPALFALEYALAELWKSWGIKPSAVMGHSLGEYVAACVAGVFSLEDGLKLTAARARLMQSLPREGVMVSVLAGQDRVAAAILPYSDDVSIAAINGSQHVVISGRHKAVHAVIAGLEGIKTQTLNVSHAFHSVLMQPIMEAFESRAGEVTYSAPRISLISNVTGQRAAEDVTTPDYWCRHVSQPVRFAAGLETLHKQGYEIFVEIGPKPTLSALGQQCLEGSRQVWLPSLRPGQSDWHQLLQSLGALYVRGVPVDWRGFDRDYARRRVSLPTYPFERERYWIPAAEVRSREIARAAKPDLNPHPLLGNQLHLAATREIRFQSQISRDFPDFLTDHRVFGAVILPATAYLEMVLAAGAAVFKSDVSIVKDVVFHQPLILPEGEERTLQLVLSPDDNDAYSFQILSLKTSAANEDISWTVHSSGKMLAQSHDLDPPMTNLSALREQIPQTVSVKDHYQGCRERGIDFGPGFQALERLWQKESDALGEIRLPERLIPAAAGFKLHPVLLDACLQVLVAATRGSPQMYLPAGLDCLRIHSRPGNTLWSHARIRPLKDSSRQTLSVDFRLFAPDGQPIASVDGLHLKRASNEALLRPAQDPHQDWLYQIEWQPKAHLTRLPPDYLAAPEELGRPQMEGDVFSRQAVVIAQATRLRQDLAEKAPEHWLVFADSEGIGQHLGMRLQSRGDLCSLVFPGKDFEQISEREFRIDPNNPDDFQRLLKLAASADAPSLRGAVNLWGLETMTAEAMTSDDLEAAARVGCGSALHLVQSLGKARFAEPPSLWLVTRGAQPAGSNHQVPGLAQSSLWGLGKTIALEHPELRCVRIDLDPGSESAEVQARNLFEEIGSASGEDQVAFRSQVRYVARLVRYSGRDQAIEERPPFRADATYLVTGGLSGLGLLAASWLVKQGARNLVLVGRSGANEEARTQLKKLEQAGAKVTAAQADVSQREQVARLLTGIEASHPPLRGIIHCAGVLDDGIMLQQTWDRFSKVMAPKVTGSWILHTLTRNKALDLFVMFSSAASLLGSPGQSNYASANAFLDALAHHRRAQGMPGLSINWGAWSEIGAARGQVGERIKLKGIETIAPQQGLRLLEQLLWRPLAQVGVVPIVWPTFIQQFPTGIDPPLMAELAPQERERAKGAQTPARQGDILRQWAAVVPEERHSCLIAYIRREVANVMRLSSAQLNADQPLTTMGLDSLMAVELRNRIKIDSGIDVPLVKFMEDFSVRSLATELNGQLEASHSSPSPVGTSLGEQQSSGVSPQEAGRILSRLDQLTDEEVDRLLTKAQVS